MNDLQQVIENKENILLKNIWFRINDLRQVIENKENIVQEKL
jgi:hypothetical protein